MPQTTGANSTFTDSLTGTPVNTNACTFSNRQWHVCYRCTGHTDAAGSATSRGCNITELLSTAHVDAHCRAPAMRPPSSPNARATARYSCCLAVRRMWASAPWCSPCSSSLSCSGGFLVGRLLYFQHTACKNAATSFATSQHSANTHHSGDPQLCGIDMVFQPCRADSGTRAQVALPAQR
jgi:hypothetical protein